MGKREDIIASSKSPTVSARRSGETMTPPATRPTSERRQTLAAKNQQQATEGGAAGLPKIVSTAADALLSFQSLEGDDSLVSDYLPPERAPARAALAPAPVRLRWGDIS